VSDWQLASPEQISDALFQASVAKQMRTVFFWVITQRVVVIYYRRFGTTYLPSSRLKNQVRYSGPLRGK
jgi:hypothetical protein